LDDTKLNNSDWTALKAAFAEWPQNYYAVFQGVKSGHGEYTCNMFTGDALYLGGETLMTGTKYYSAGNIANGADGGLVAVPMDQVARGDVASMHNGGHVEVVTSVLA